MISAQPNSRTVPSLSQPAGAAPTAFGNLHATAVTAAPPAACLPLALVMPYMVCGRITVSSGVLWRGVLLPNTAMVLGAYTDRP